MTAPIILTIDVGTSSLKAVLYDDGGQVVAGTKQRYEYDIPQPGWAECDPVVWWSALVAALVDMRSMGHDLLAVSCIGITGQMHTPPSCLMTTTCHYASEETVTRPLYAHCRTTLDNKPSFNPIRGWRIFPLAH